MHIAAGRFFIDGNDLWTNFGIVARSGSTDGFLKQPKKKESLTHDWQDTNGIDVDLSKIYLDKRDIPLKLAMVANTEEDFWRQHTQFFAMWTQPGLRRLTVRELDRDFYVYYNDTTDYSKLKNLKAIGKLFFLFTLVITEPKPSINEVFFLADEDGVFIIT